MTKKIYLIRHAEGYHNVNENYHLFNPELTPKGHQQILEKKEGLKKIKFNKIFVSPLTRTLQTATCLFGKVDMIALEEIREIICNPCDLRIPLTESVLEFPHVNFSLIIKNIDDFDKDNLIKENDYKKEERILYVDNMLRSLDATHIAIVTHGAFIEHFMEFIHNKKYVFLNNCETIILDY
ncbi:Histidine phosphatase superfamily (branch 1) [seawater metagenome]|uniref:Histidine phosphatase superfamily (Branch 1) n=1 Tax=seawater metagenome TaxID=1561972 RepID=A0A5E8CI29_9ZZZZ